MSTVIVAEIGANHNGSLDVALQMIAAAKQAGADYVKFQKRDVDLAVPEAQKAVPRETPWGTMPYLQYRRKLEFGKEEFGIIDSYCKSHGIKWFASVWDIPSYEFMVGFHPDYFKVPSAKLTDLDLLDVMSTGRNMVLSAGMSTMEEVKKAVARLHPEWLLHCVSTYPAANEALNLRQIPALAELFPECSIGYSGHERGIAPSVAAVALGAGMVERHFTLDRAMWGTDQAASLEPVGFTRMVKDIRIVEQSLGDGVKRILPQEVEMRAKLRG